MQSLNPFKLDIPLIQEWLIAAGNIALNDFLDRNKGYQYKTDRTPVTEADEAVEYYLANKIQKTYPDHGIIAEEQTSIQGNEYTWVIDPIDGTSAFVMGLPTWCIAMGLLKQGNPIWGMVYLPVTKELYHGHIDGTAYWNGQEINISEQAISDQSVLYVSTYSHQFHSISFPGRIFSIGSGIYQHLLVARGAAIAAITLRPKIWDLAASFPILKAAGASIQYTSGNDVIFSDYASGKTEPLPIVTGNNRILIQLSKMIPYHEK